MRSRGLLPLPATCFCDLRPLLLFLPRRSTGRFHIAQSLGAVASKRQQQSLMSCATWTEAATLTASVSRYDDKPGSNARDLLAST